MWSACESLKTKHGDCRKGVKIVALIGKGERKRENYGMETLKQGGE